MTIRKLWRWWPVLSLSLNVFLVALIGSHFLLRPSGPPPPLEDMVEDIAQRLPAHDGEVLRQSFSRYAAELKEAHVKGRKNVGDILEALAAPRFDADRLRLLFMQGRIERDHMERLVESIAIESAEGMSDEGRQQLPGLFPPPPP